MDTAIVHVREIGLDSIKKQGKELDAFEGTSSPRLLADFEPVTMGKLIRKYK